MALWGARVSEFCHLHQVIEQITSGDFRVNADLFEGMPITPKKLLQMMLPMARHAMCFYMGTDEGSNQVAGIPGLFKLPFQSCWFEMSLDSTQQSDGLSRFGVLAAASTVGKVTYLIFSRYRESGAKWFLYAVSTANEEARDFDGTPGIKGVLFPGGGAIETDVLFITRALWGFVSAMHCTNIGRQEHRVSEKLQQARIRRGKPPLFSYWTLHLRGRQESGAPLGGTHASPRVHLRRGHPRQFSPGRWTWVQPHAVGNRAAGMVHKDYDGSRLSTVPQINHHSKAHP